MTPDQKKKVVAFPVNDTHAKLDELRKKLRSQNQTRRGVAGTATANYRNPSIGSDTLNKSHSVHTGHKRAMTQMSDKFEATTADASMFGDSFTVKKLIKSKIENVAPKRNFSATETVLALNKRTANISSPKYGMKGYVVQDSKLKDKIYQIPKIVKYIEN